MTSQSNPDTQSRLEMLRRNLSDATNPRIVARSPSLGAPKVIAQIRTEIKKLEEELKGGRPKPAAPTGAVRVDGAYDFPLGAVLSGHGGHPWIFTGWGRNTAGLLPVFVRSMQNAYPSNQSVQMECPATEDTLLKRFPGAVVYRIPAAPARGRSYKAAEPVQEQHGSGEVRLEDTYVFEPGDTITDRKGRSYAFTGWRENRSGRIPIFQHNHQSGAVWEIKSVYEDTLLKRFPDAVKYRKQS